MHNKKEIENHYLNYVVLLLFIGIWGSLASDPYDFLILFDSAIEVEFEINLVNIVNLIRAVFPSICLIICSIIIIKFKIFFKQDRFIYILFIIQLFQLISTFFSQNSFINEIESTLDHIGRYNWIISSLATILIFMIANKLKYFDMKKLFLISIFFLTIIIIWFTFISIKDFYTLNVKTSLYNLDVYRDSAYLLGHPMPRLTGLSRSIIFIYILILFLKFDENKYLVLLKYLLLIILGSLLFLYQSKFALITFLIIKIYYFLISKKKFKAGIIILFLVASQILMFLGISNLRTIETDILKNNTNTTKTEIIKRDHNIKHFRTFYFTSKTGLDLAQQLFFSGRVTLWLKSFELYIDRPILGYGSMWDRIALNKLRLDDSISYNPVSNAFIYCLVSGGLFSLALFIYFWINIRNKVFNIYWLNVNHNYYVQLRSLLIAVIFLRCFIENSIMIFGIDFIVLLNSLYLIKEK